MMPVEGHWHNSFARKPSMEYIHTVSHCCAGENTTCSIPIIQDDNESVLTLILQNCQQFAQWDTALLTVKTMASFWAAECRLFWDRWDRSFPVIIVGTVYLYFMQSAQFQNESPVSILSAVTAQVSYSI